VSLDPRDRKNWTGFLDGLQPPAGYRLAAAVGTTFGLSLDALTAALLAMSEADGEALAGDPVAGVIAVTRVDYHGERCLEQIVIDRFFDDLIDLTDHERLQQVKSWEWKVE
jgi:hypothetical protein